MSGKRITRIIGCLVVLALAKVGAVEKITFQGGTQMGYTYGQNGGGWPNLTRDALGNPGRGGFYINQLRLQTRIVFDSTFSGVAVGNLMNSDIQEVYLEKLWAGYRITAGKFRGAGLKSGTGYGEFDRVTINPPRYAQAWAGFAHTFNYRDFGIQVERAFLDGNLRNRLFVHNANGENVRNEEPSSQAGKTTQVLGLDYALDWRISPFTVWGGHIGILADRSWDEFVGSHDGWQAQYWFKSNAFASGSLNHQLDAGRFHMFNETMAMSHRTILNPSDSAATQSWGASSLLRFDHSEKWGSFFRYEFYDNTDGYNHDDGLHLFTLGAAWHPSPKAYPDLKVTGEYVRTYEEGLVNSFPNDLLYCQLQMLF